jgi:hypothetical protein
MGTNLFGRYRPDYHLKYAEAVGLTPAVSRPALTPGTEPAEGETRRRVTVEVEKK